MGLIKNIELDTGVVASYHMISSITKSYDVARGYEYIVGIDTYLNQDVRIAEKKPLEKTELRTQMADSLPEVYTMLKQLVKFSGAEDAL